MSPDTIENRQYTDEGNKDGHENDPGGTKTVFLTHPILSAVVVRSI